MFGFKKDLARIVAQLEAMQSTMVQPVAAPIADDSVTNITDGLAQVVEDVERLEREFKDVLQAVAEGIERTERAERRIAQTVKRARKELKDRDLEDAGLEAEAAQLRSGDGERSDGDGLRPLPNRMAPTGEEASSIKGVSVAVLSRARGF